MCCDPSREIRSRTGRSQRSWHPSNPDLLPVASSLVSCSATRRRPEMLCQAAATQQSQTTPSSKTRLGRTREVFLLGIQDVGTSREVLVAPNREYRAW